MLTVHRQKLDVILPDGIRHEGTSGDKALLVGQRHVLARLERREGRAQAHHPDHRV